MSLAKSSGLFAAGTFISRISGLLRDQVILAVLGASELQDAFTVAFRIPNLLRDMLAEGALGNAFTKVYSSVRHENPERAQRLLIDFLHLVFFATLVICSLGMIFAPELVGLMTQFGSGKHTALASDSQFIHNTTGLTRVLFPYLGLAILGAVVMGALHQGGRFFLSALSPIGFNLGNIVGAIGIAHLLNTFAPEWTREYIADPTITGLAIGVLIGGLAQLAMQTAGIYRNHLKGKMKWQGIPWSPDTKNVLVLMFPAALAASSGPINVMVNTNFATSLPAGSVSWLNFAFRLLQLPVGIFGVAVGSAVLPALARSIKSSERKLATEEASDHLQTALELVLWALVPCMVFLYINNVPLIDALFRHGRFTRGDAINTAAALEAYSYGLVAYGLIKVFSSFYFAVERTTYAMIVSIISIGVNYAGNSILVEKFAFQGLAWTASVSLSINALILFAGLGRHKIQWKLSRLFRSLGILGTATALSGSLQALVLRFVCGVNFVQWYQSATKIQIYGILALNIVLCILTYAVFAGWAMRKGPRALLQVPKRKRR